MFPIFFPHVYVEEMEKGRNKFPRPVFKEKELKDGEPCSHPGCLNHISHPCEGCGRIAGISDPSKPYFIISDKGFSTGWKAGETIVIPIPIKIEGDNDNEK